MGSRRPGIEIHASPRFLKAYSKANVVLQGCAEGALHDLVRRYSSDPSQWLRAYDRVESVDGRIVEVDLNGGARLLAHWEPNRLTLVDMGDHEVVGRYQRKSLDADLRQATPAPAQFLPYTANGFFSHTPSLEGGQFANELSPEWVYFLDDEQERVSQAIIASAEAVLLRDGYYQSFFIVGGPGTGKTCILLNLLKHFHHREGFEVKMLIGDRVADYIQAATGIEMAAFRAPYSQMIADVLLIDDPRGLDSLNRALAEGRAGSTKVVVLAFDPLQLLDALPDERFDALVAEHNVRVHTLQSCYRQKENVGSAAKKAIQAIADSTPFLDETKVEAFREEHERLTELANALTFRNPHGYVATYPEATSAEWNRELHRIRKPSQLWKHWSPLLVVVDTEHGVELEPSWTAACDDLRTEVVSLQAVEEIKGLEYQHVFLVISKGLYSEVELGFSGSGQRVYNKRRLLRIPFSRAKDSLVTFVV